MCQSFHSPTPWLALNKVWVDVPLPAFMPSSPHAIVRWEWIGTHLYPTVEFFGRARERCRFRLRPELVQCVDVAIQGVEGGRDAGPGHRHPGPRHRQHRLPGPVEPGTRVAHPRAGHRAGARRSGRCDPPAYPAYPAYPACPRTRTASPSTGNGGSAPDSPAPDTDPGTPRGSSPIGSAIRATGRIDVRTATNIDTLSTVVGFPAPTVSAAVPAASFDRCRGK